MRYKGETWKEYIDKLSRINSRAADEMRSYILKGHTDAEAMQYAFALADRYGNAAATLTCSFYDSVAEAAGVTVPPAEPASPPSFGEIAKTVNGTKDNSEVLANAIGRLCKRTSADTLLNNALRDGAQVAWIPSGDTCAFCFTLASRGWGYVTKKTLKKGHAEHIHANCDCTYAVRFNTTDNVEGYDPEAMREEYYAESGINGLRRKFYVQNKDKINAQKRARYANLKARETLAKMRQNGNINSIFNSLDDPMRTLLGDAKSSHPQTLDAIVADLKKAGVSIKIREGTMGYSPSLIPGMPGELVIEPQASISAWLHEYKHFYDDRKDGYLGMRVFADREKCYSREWNAYEVEIRFARSMDADGVVKQLEELRIKGVEEYV